MDETIGGDPAQVFWKDTAQELARAVLSLAQDAGMPGSYWFTDSRIELACATLGLQKDEAKETDWESDE